MYSTLVRLLIPIPFYALFPNARVRLSSQWFRHTTCLAVKHSTIIHKYFHLTTVYDLSDVMFLAFLNDIRLDSSHFVHILFHSSRGDIQGPLASRPHLAQCRKKKKYGAYESVRELEANHSVQAIATKRESKVTMRQCVVIHHSLIGGIDNSNRPTLSRKYHRLDAFQHLMTQSVSCPMFRIKPGGTIKNTSDSDTEAITFTG